MKLGRGVIIVSTHTGPYWYFAHIPSLLGIKDTSIVQKEQYEALCKYVGVVKKAGHQFIAADRSLRDLLHLLNKGEAISMLVDRPLTHQSIGVHMFGRFIQLPVGHVWLSIKSGAPIVIVHSKRMIDNKFIVNYKPGIPAETFSVHNNFQQALQNGVSAVAHNIEPEIKNNLGQWLTLIWDKL